MVHNIYSVLEKMGVKTGKCYIGEHMIVKFDMEKKIAFGLDLESGIVGLGSSIQSFISLKEAFSLYPLDAHAYNMLYQYAYENSNDDEIIDEIVHASIKVMVESFYYSYNLHKGTKPVYHVVKFDNGNITKISKAFTTEKEAYEKMLGVITDMMVEFAHDNHLWRLNGFKIDYSNKSITFNENHEELRVVEVADNFINFN